MVAPCTVVDPAVQRRRRAARAALPPRRRSADRVGLRSPHAVRRLATRAITLGRRSDAYIGCVPCTRRHGDRDAVDHSFVLWTDGDGEGRALASLS
jgi:hypothetical protein